MGYVLYTEQNEVYTITYNKLHAEELKKRYDLKIVETEVE